MKNSLILGNLLAFCPFVLGIVLLALFPLMAEIVFAAGLVGVAYALGLRLTRGKSIEFMPVLLLAVQLLLAAGLILLFLAIQTR